MHHYTLDTCTTLMHHEHSALIFQKWIPEAAMHQPHLTRGVLALSAFHLAHKQGPDNSLWMKLAVKNQTIASVALREALETMNDENSPGMFILSIILGLTSFAATNCLQSPSVSDFVECFMLVRGPTNISMSMGTHPKAFSAQFWPLTLGYSVIDECREDPLPESIAEHMQAVREMIEVSVLDQTDREILLVAFVKLESLYKEVVHTKGTANGNAAFLWKWSGGASPEYVTILRSLDPYALVLFAHFAMLTHIFDNDWFFQGWAERTVDVIASHLAPPHKEILDWPKAQLENNLESFRS
jgi:hypothetical protein